MHEECWAPSLRGVDIHLVLISLNRIHLAAQLPVGAPSRVMDAVVRNAKVNMSRPQKKLYIYIYTPKLRIASHESSSLAIWPCFFLRNNIPREEPLLGAGVDLFDGSRHRPEEGPLSFTDGHIAFWRRRPFWGKSEAVAMSGGQLCLNLSLSTGGGLWGVTPSSKLTETH